MRLETFFHLLAEKFEKPNFDNVTADALAYRQHGDNEAFQRFTRKLQSRSPRYLSNLIAHNAHNSEALAAIANCMNGIYDDIIKVEDLKNLL